MDIRTILEYIDALELAGEQLEADLQVARSRQTEWRIAASEWQGKAVIAERDAQVSREMFRGEALRHQATAAWLREELENSGKTDKSRIC